jgi:hypothetical protein
MVYPEVETFAVFGQLGAHRTNTRNKVTLLYVKRPAGDESAVASAPLPTSGRRQSSKVVTGVFVSC